MLSIGLLLKTEILLDALCFLKGGIGCVWCITNLPPLNGVSRRWLIFIIKFLEFNRFCRYCLRYR